MPELAFLSPERLLILLVIPLLVLAYIFASRRKNRRGMRFTNTSMLDVVVPKQSQWRRHLAVALSLLSLITLTAAFARPKTQVDVPRERATVVLVIDASLSMQATDVQADPAGRGQGGGDRVRQRSCRRSTTSRWSPWPARRPSWCRRPPPTTRSRTRSAASGCRTRRRIGEGIAAALSALRQAPKDPDDPDSVAPGAIVLLTDGKNTIGRAPLQAAAEAKAAKVPIYTIAYGTENGYVDLDGKREPVPVDHEAMQEIAAAHQRAATSPRPPPRSSRRCTRTSAPTVGYEKADREVTARFAGYGLALAVLAALGAISLGAKWP